MLYNPGRYIVLILPAIALLIVLILTVPVAATGSQPANPPETGPSTPLNAGGSYPGSSSALSLRLRNWSYLSSLSSVPATQPNEQQNRRFFTLDFDGQLARVPLNSAGAITDRLLVVHPEGSYTLEMPAGTVTCDQKGNIVDWMQIRPTPMPVLPEDKVAISEAFTFQPEGISFSQPVHISLKYMPDLLTKQTTAVNLACSSADLGWIDLPVAGGVVAEVGQVSGTIQQSSTFALLATRASAVFKAESLNISLSSLKTWGKFAFVVKTGEKANVTVGMKNEGGLKGTYSAILKLNGAHVGKKDITLEPGKTGEISFALTGMPPGEYSVDVAGLSGVFKGTFWINWWLIAGCVLGLAALFWLARKYIGRVNILN